MRTSRYIILIPVIVMFCLWWVRRDLIALDGFEGELFGLVFKTDTRYAAGYEHPKFRAIEIGMTEQQVIEILGEPLSRWCPYQFCDCDKAHFVGFEYSESPSDTHYRLRQVYLDQGKVAEIRSEFYID
jgi:hypothetical protein